MTTRERFAKMPGVMLDEYIAEHLMGWQHQGSLWIPPERWQSLDSPPPYSAVLLLAWEVLQRITRLPQTPEESEKAARSFIYEWARGNVWALNEREAARWICETAMVSWLEAPYYEEAVRESQARA